MIVLYSELNVKIERTTRIVDFVLAKLTVIGTVLPAATLTVVNHFVNGDETSYQLPYPVM